MLGEQGRAADQHLGPVDGAAGAEPGQRAEPAASGSGPASARAAALTAAATACSDASSTEPAFRSRVSRLVPSAASTAVSVIRPVVTVPVLSSTTTSTPRDASSAWYSLTKIPLRAPRPHAATSAAGVARPSAQGQAMISTASPALTAPAGAPASSQPARVAAAQARTAGTNTPETRSATRWTAALCAWARSTSAMSWASWVSRPTLTARTTRRPVSTTVPPVTRSPSAASPGTDSPVIIERSTALRPNSTSPSAATVSPGRTMNRIPGASASAAPAARFRPAQQPHLPGRRAGQVAHRLAGHSRARASYSRRRAGRW